MDTLERINSLLDDEKFATVTSLVIALYAGMAAPALPDSVVLFFDTIVGKLLFLFLIGFMASRNIRVALMIAVAFVVTLHVVNQRNTEKYFNYRRESFEGNEDDGKNPQEREVNASDFTTNVDEHFADHPLAEDISPKDTFGGHDDEDAPEEGHEDEPEDYITPKDTFANMEDEPEDYITPKDTFTGDAEVVPEEGHEDEPEDYITPKDTFRNYNLERFTDDEDSPTEGPGSKEHMDPEMDDVDGFQPNVEEGHEDEPEEAHEDEPEEGHEDEPEGFYSNINPTARNFGVNPANNTSGRTGNMYARVRFH
tara:strand:- start:1035 stop:1964 length:930 start_codon:yes stop_codon:yes gene_type:complete